MSDTISGAALNDRIARVVAYAMPSASTAHDDRIAYAPEYGALGDGVTDDTAALQRALDSGKSVYIPGGMVCAVSASLRFTEAGQTLFGAGAEASVIKATGSFNVVTALAGIDYLTVRDLTIDTAAALSGYAVSFNQNSRVEVRNVRLRSAWNGIYAQRFSKLMIANVIGTLIRGDYAINLYDTEHSPGADQAFIQDTIFGGDLSYRTIGISIDAGVATVNVTDCAFVSMKRGVQCINTSGVAANASRYLICWNLQVDANTAESVRLEDMKYVMLYSCYLHPGINSTNADTIWANSATNGTLVIDGGQVLGAAGANIRWGGDSLVVTGTELGNVAVTGAYMTDAAVVIEATSQRARIFGNTFGRQGGSNLGATHKYGVHVKSGAIQTLITGNDMERCGAAAVRNDAADWETVAVGNIGVGSNIVEGVQSSLRPGMGALATATVVAGVITAITVDNQGQGYFGATVNILSGGLGSGATATATVTNGRVASITVGAGGSGYVSGQVAVRITPNSAGRAVFRALDNDTDRNVRVQSQGATTSVEIGNDAAMGLTVSDTTATFTALPRMPTYTVATLPAASVSNVRAVVYVSNESGGATLAFSDGINWRRVQDRIVVS